MNQLKKILFALAVAVSLGLVGASSAYAQLTCSSTAGNPIVRSEGIAEMVGTITFSCSEPGGSPATPVTSLTITLLPGTAGITNSPTVLPTISVDNSAGVAGAIAGNTVTFAIPAFAACAAVAPAVCLHTLIVGINPSSVAPATTIGLRVNIFSSGIVFPGAVRELTTTPNNGVITLTNSQLDVATPLPGLSAAFSSGGAFAQCSSATVPSTPTVATSTLTTSATVFNVVNPATGVATTAGLSKPIVTVTEGFNTAFQVVGVGGEGGDSTQGTRIIFRFGALPANVGIVANNVVTILGGGTLTLTLVPADSTGAGGSPVGVVAGATVLTGITATYEVTATSNAVLEVIGVPFGLFTTGTASPAGTSTVSVNLAPLSTVLTPISTPIPRFGDRAVSGNLVAVIPCLSNIFYPWVVNIAGYDTGFAVANTTTDIFGTASQSGTCVYNFFGTNGPSGGTFTTAAFAGGTVNTQLLSVIAPGFAGYVIIQCNFQLGHGFVFIVNGFGGGAATLAEGGPAMIIGQPGSTSGTSRRGLASVGPPFGEGLGH